MDWELVDERFEMVERLAHHIKFRKAIIERTDSLDQKDVLTAFDVSYWGNGILAYSSDKAKPLTGWSKVAILINPTLVKQVYELDDYYSLLLGIDEKGEEINMKNGMIPPLSVQFLYKK